jgi:hypothetical protein
MDVGNGPLGLNPLDIRVILWNIHEDGMCIFEFFENISSNLVNVF